MRIDVAGPSKTRIVWQNRMLPGACDLRLLDIVEFPARADLAAVTDWLGDGGFPDNSVFPQHHDHSPALADTFGVVPARVVTIVGASYDTFVSAYVAQQQSNGAGGDDGTRAGRRPSAILGKPLASPEMYDYRRAGVSRNVVRARDRMKSGRLLIAHYEDLIEAPVNALARLTAGIQPVLGHRLDTGGRAEQRRKLARDERQHRPTCPGGERWQLVREAGRAAPDHRSGSAHILEPGAGVRGAINPLRSGGAGRTAYIGGNIGERLECAS